MYTDYWQLEAKPFEGGADPAFVYPCEQQRSAVHKLRYAIEGRRAAVAVVGPTGVGKTMLLDQLLAALGEDSGPTVRLYFPLMSPRDLLVYFAEQLGAPPADPIQQTVEESLRRLEFTLGEIRRRGQHAVLVVEEAHLLEDSGLLETLRLLLNIRVEGRPTFTLVLVGHPSLLAALGRHTSLDHRIDLKVVVKPLTQEGAAEYVRHRMAAAGSTREVFDAAALELVYRLTGGVPQRINRLCDLSLLVGFANQAAGVTAADVEAVSQELLITPLAA